MKSFLFGILVLLFACSQWTDREEYHLVVDAGEGVEFVEAGAIRQCEDKITGVRLALDSSGDISVPTPSSLFSQFARRYRLAGFGWEKAFDRLAEGQSVCHHVTYKVVALCSGEYAACLKHAGYYIYALRKIII